MKINKDIIMQYNPCRDRINNYIAHYGNKSFTLNQFINLENITYRDKIWVLARIASNFTKTVWAIDSAFRAYADAAIYAADAAYYVDTTNNVDAAAYAADAAHCAADSAAYFNDYAAYDKARVESLEVLVYLLNNEEKTNETRK